MKAKKNIKNLGRAWTHKVNVIFWDFFQGQFFFKFKQKENRMGKRKEQKKEGVFSKVVERKKVKGKREN